MSLLLHLLQTLTERRCYVDSLLRVLNVIFWVSAALAVASLVFYDFAAGLFGDKGLPIVIAVLLGVVVVCSGAIALYEFRLNPLADTERGEWTGRQLFYALVFTISFFVAFLYILTVVF
jgi:hypothetical protein